MRGERVRRPRRRRPLPRVDDDDLRTVLRMASTSSGTSPDVQVLMGKGKRGAAAYISLTTGRDAGGCPPYLNELLDVLLNPSKPIDDWETIDWCKWLMAGGRTPDEFASTGGYPR